MRTLFSRILSTLAVAALVSAASVSASTEIWRVVKQGPTVNSGEIAFVGSIVRRPTTIAVRAIASRPESITLTVTTSCRKGLKTRVGREQLAGRASYTRTIRLPLGGADNCAVSATGSSTAGTLRLELLRSS